MNARDNFTSRAFVQALQQYNTLMEGSEAEYARKEALKLYKVSIILRLQFFQYGLITVSPVHSVSITDTDT